MLYFVVSGSKHAVFHSHSCRHIKGKPESDVKVYRSLSSVIKLGCRPCKHCLSSKLQLFKELPTVLDFASRHQMSVNFMDENVEVQSYSGTWRICKTNQGFTLMHKNTRGKPGYHLQNYYSNALLQQLEYINDHDFYRYRHPEQNQPRKKAAPKKGTKRYKKQLANKKRRERNQSIASVLRTIESLSA